jgi:xanthine dehydrogenase iron-sulfur cluster and FAD-binding subunit A
VYIPTGCLSGSCGICEVEVAKLVDSSASDPSPAVIRACIAKVPPGYAELRVKNMEDAIWGQDGFDT